MTKDISVGPNAAQAHPGAANRLFAAHKAKSHGGKGQATQATDEGAAFELEFAGATRAAEGKRDDVPLTHHKKDASIGDNKKGDHDQNSADTADVATTEKTTAAAAPSPDANAGATSAASWMAQLTQTMAGASTPLKDNGAADATTGSSAGVHHATSRRAAGSTSLATPRDADSKQNISERQHTDADQMFVPVDASDQQVSDLPDVTVHGTSAHWIFDAPTTYVPSAAADISPHAVLASLLGGEAAKQTGQTGQQTADAQSGKNVSSAHGDKANVAQVAGAASSHDAGEGGQFGEPSSSNGGETRQGPKLDAASARATAEAKSTGSVDKVADAPVAPTPSAVQQVKTTVIDALSNSDTQANNPASSPNLPQDRPVATGQVLRTIDLTLEPPDLGSLRLRLSLKANALAIDAETSKASTAKLLNDDRDSLEKGLRTAGYDVAAIRVSDASSVSNGSLGSNSFQDGSQARANYNGRDANGGDLPRRQGGNGEQQDRRSPPDERQARSAPSDRSSTRQPNAVYI